MTLQEIIARRTEIAARMAAIVGIVEAEARTLSAEEVAESDTLEQEDTSLGARQPDVAFQKKPAGGHAQRAESAAAFFGVVSAGEGPASRSDVILNRIGGVEPRAVNDPHRGAQQRHRTE